MIIRIISDNIALYVTGAMYARNPEYYQRAIAGDLPARRFYVFPANICAEICREIGAKLNQTSLISNRDDEARQAGYALVPADGRGFNAVSYMVKDHGELFYEEELDAAIKNYGSACPLYWPIHPHDQIPGYDKVSKARDRLKRYRADLADRRAYRARKEA